MVYMAAVRDDLETEQAAIRDLRELQRVGSTEAVKVVVQLDRNWPGTPERYIVRKGISERAPESATRHGSANQRRTRRRGDRTSSGDREALSSFLEWSLKEHRAKRYLLVLWGHSYGLGFGRDHGDALTLQELREALGIFGADGGQLDLLGANACAMSYAEAAYELRDGAKYLVASEITMPFSGWPYSAILQRMNERLGQGSDLSPEDLGGLIVDEFMRSFRHNGVALSLLNLHKTDLLPTRVRALAQALKPAMTTPDLSDRVADAFLDSAHGNVRPLIDLRDLCTHLATTGDPFIVDAATRLGTELEPGHNRLIVRHEADPDFEGLHGLGIFATAVTSASDLVRLEIDRSQYEALELMRQTDKVWTEIVYDDLADVLEPMNAEIEEYVSGSRCQLAR